MSGTVVLSLSLFAFPTALLNAQTTSIWNGASNSAWTEVGNWSNGVPNATTAIAEFSSSSGNTNVNLNAAVTLQRLDFLTGAAAYTLATSNASTLTINAASGDTFIQNASGQNQTISTNLTLAISSTGTSTIVDVGAGSTLTLTGQLATSGSSSSHNIGFQGGGTINVNGTFSAVNILRVSSGTTLNYNPTNAAGANNIFADAGGRVNVLANPLSARTLTISGAGAEMYVQRTGTTNTGDINLRGTGRGIKTFGADIAAGGTATIIVASDKKLNLNHTEALTNTTYRFHANANTTLVLDAVIHDAGTSQSGTKLEIVGGGTVRFSGSAANTSVTPVVVTAGHLELNKTAGIAAIAGGSVTVNQNAELRLLASNQIADTTTLSLNGGRFTVNAFSETLGELNVSALGGSLALDASSGTGSVTFASLGALDGTLTIYGWTESASIVFTDITNWNAAALAKVTFDGIGQGAALDGDKLVAVTVVPEPAIWSALIGVIVLAGTLLVRRKTDHC
ncbi:cell wall anchor protein [Opitutaceae bacterium TAV3]|nr:cell wall anchor protein [Opitutaceae bacterium TAV3]